MTKKKAKVMDHPIAHEEITNEDRLIFLIVGVLVTLTVFVVMKVFEL